MANRDLNALATEHEDKAEIDLQERYDNLQRQLVGTFNKVLDRFFPHDKASGDPDWDNFDWRNAEQFLNELDRIRRGDTRPNGTPAQPDQPPRRRGGTSPAPAAPDPAQDQPTAVAPATTPPARQQPPERKGVIRSIKDKIKPV